MTFFPYLKISPAMDDMTPEYFPHVLIYHWKDDIIYLDNKERRSGLTNYAKAQGAYTYDDYSVDGKASCRWWLRTPSYQAALVDTVGEVNEYGSHEFDVDECVRPALWIDPES